MDGFDGRLSYITGSILRDEDVQKDLSDRVADFMVRLNRYRAVIRPKQLPHCQSQDIHGDPIIFDAFIKLRDDNMKVIEDQLHIRLHQYCANDIHSERSCVNRRVTANCRYQRIVGRM